VEFKGGGDPVSAARAVLQTGEYDYGWGLNMEDEILRRLEDGSKGRVVIGRTTNIDYLQLNQADPWRDVDGERASIKTTHPFLTDPAVHSALALLVDRAAIQGEIWGRQGETTGNFLNRRPFASPNTRWEFNPDRANAVLDAAGWKRGADGIRAKDSNPRMSGGRAARGCRSLGDARRRRGRHAPDAEPVDAQPVAHDRPEAGGLEQHRGDGDH